MSRALAGIRILDLADRSAALAGRILGDLGAEVIMVEPPTGNSIRHLAPFVDGAPGLETSFAHQYYSANKGSVTIDLDDDHGRNQFRALVATCDVIIDTEHPGQLESLGLGHGALRSVNPSLIQCSITPFGLDTPWRDRLATDIVAGAASGLIWLSGESRGRPVQGGANVSYAMAGLCASSAISTALHQRDNTDGPDRPGAHIDLSLQEATVMAAMQTATPSQWTWHGRIPRRPGLSSALRCADGGYVGHMVRPDRFAGFLEWADRVGIDHGMTIDDWGWSRLDAPRKDNPVAETTLALAAKLTRDEFAAGALEAGLICLPVLDFVDLARTEQYLVNDQFQTVRSDSLDIELGFVRSPVDALEDGVEIHPAPALGADQSIVDALAAVDPTTPSPAPALAAASTDPSQALAGIRVVDFSWVLAGPIGTRILASFGAEVIRVESATKPDSMRGGIGPDGQPDPDMAGLFNSVNAGKLSLAVDLRTNAGLTLVKDLIATADVVVNNFRPGAMERMGLGFDVLQSLRPDIVALNLPGAHRHGPWAVRPSMGNILMAASGFNMLTGFDGERPRGIGVAYPDFTSPHLLASTILAALRHRRDTGDGQEIHLTQLSATLALLGAEWMEYVATGQQPPRRANRDPNLCPHGIFAATPSDHSDDEWVAVAVDGDAQWRQLCTLMQQPELANDPRFTTHADRKANEDELDVIVESWTASADKWDLADQLQAAGIAAAPVEHLAETYERDPQLQHHYLTVHQPSRPEIDIPIDRPAAQWVGSKHQLRRSPGLGEHNEYLIRELLGRSDEEYVELVIGDVLG